MVVETADRIDIAEVTVAREVGSHRLRLAVVDDFREEGWPSMDLCAEMLMHYGPMHAAERIQFEAVCPPFADWARRIPFASNATRFTMNRLFNRFVNYPRHLRAARSSYDVFHLCDHSYAQLVHALPAERVGVYCHDLDTFRCLLEPDREPRSWAFRHMASRILTGLQRAAIVFVNTRDTASRLQQFEVVDPVKIVLAPCGVAPEFEDVTKRSLSGTSADVRRLCGSRRYLLHVGSCIPRKRIDVLINVFARLHDRDRDLQLVQVGGTWLPEHEALLDQRRLHGHATQFRGIDRRLLASLYRHAAVVLQTSEAEGFGLPVAEAMACGTPVIASDLPVLREVGGVAAAYAPVGQIEQWVETAVRLLSKPMSDVDRAFRQAQAARFSWAKHVETICNAYAELVHREV